MHLQDVRDVLRDPTRPRAQRLLRLQGWRGDDVEVALAAGGAMRLGPAACAGLGVVGLVADNATFYAAFAVLSAVGVVARNHPVELVWIWWARRRDHVVPPANRCGRRFACGLGALLFALAGAGVAWELAGLALGAGLAMVVVPAFVATTNLCLPSLLLTAVLGADRVSCRWTGLGSSDPRRSARRAPQPVRVGPDPTSAVVRHRSILGRIR